MSWRNTDRAFGSRARGLRGVDGMGASGLYGFVPPSSRPIMRWRNTDRSWGNRPRGLPFTGPVPAGMSGLGQDTTDLSNLPLSTDVTMVPLTEAPLTVPGAVAAPSMWPQAVTGIAQAGFQDAFNILKLLNPVPPGTVMQTGPAGTFISRAAAGQPTPSALTSPFGAGTGSSLLLLAGLGIVVFMLASRK